MTEHHITLTRLPCMAPVTRRWVRGLLTTCPRLEDAETVVSELVADNVRYGVLDGFQIALTTREGSVRVAVSDHTDAYLTDPDHMFTAGSDREHGDEAEEAEVHARCLSLVNALSDRWGHERDEDGSSTLWSELHW